MGPSRAPAASILKEAEDFFFDERKLIAALSA